MSLPASRVGRPRPAATFASLRRPARCPCRPWSRAFSTGSTRGKDPDAAEGAGAAAGTSAAGAAEGAGVAPAGEALAGAAAEAAGSATSPQDLSDYHTLLPKLVVFGGSGYVGSRVCQQALANGCGVVSVNRSGRPRNLRGDWLDQVEWVQVGQGMRRVVAAAGALESGVGVAVQQSGGAMRAGCSSVLHLQHKTPAAAGWPPAGAPAIQSMLSPYSRTGRRAMRWTPSRRGVTCSRGRQGRCPRWAPLATMTSCTRQAAGGMCLHLSWVAGGRRQSSVPRLVMGLPGGRAGETCCKRDASGPCSRLSHVQAASSGSS